MSDKQRLLRQGAAQLGIELGDEACARLLVYLAELAKWSQRINLIARDTPELQVLANHFLDSLSLLPLLQGEGRPVHLVSQPEPIASSSSQRHVYFWKNNYIGT